MSDTTLSISQVVGLDSSGNGVIRLRPDTGQYWAPLFVRVSTGSRNTPVAYCALYHGSPGVPVQQSQFIDDTFLGSGDTSSMIAGTPVVPGEALIFSFQGGSPGDTAIATVYGMQSDVPPNLGILPQVPGTHFTGHASTEIVNTQSFVPLSSPVTVPTLSQIVLTGNPNNAVDVRQYASYYIKVYATTLGSATGWNTGQLALSWYSSASKINGTLLYQDAHTWFADSPGGGFFVAQGLLETQDTMHGPYMDIQFSNQSTTDALQVTYIVQFTTRTIPGPYTRQQSNGLQGIILNTGTVAIGAGATIRNIAGYDYGRTWLKMTAFNPSGLDFIFTYGDTTNVDTITLAANTTDRREIVIPKKALAIDVHNGTGTGGSYALLAITQFDKV